MSVELAPLDAALDGDTLIEASAGTGKTHTITTLYVRLLLERGLDVRQILVVTYTAAATAELRTKVRARLLAALRAIEAHRPDVPAPDDQDAQLWQLAARREAQRDADRERLLLALHGFDQAAIFTIHGFCERVLHDFAFESGADFDAELTTDQTALLDEVIADFWVRALSPASLSTVAALRGERQRLIGLAKKVVAQRDLTVLPEDGAGGAAALSAAELAWQAAHAAAAALWRRDGDALIARLCDPATGLKKTSYDPKKLCAEWQPALTRLFASDEAVGLDTARPAVERLAAARLATGVKKGFAAPADPFFDACERLLAADQALQAAVAQRAVGLRVELAAYVSRELARRKRAARVRYFDDLLHGLAEALNTPGPGAATLAQALRVRFPAALIDEFQDTDPLQYDIVRRIYHGAADACLFLIGDPKQAIYGFRGADVFAYLAAKRDTAARTYTLRQSWRSDPRLLDAINALFGVAAPFVVDGIDYEDQRPAPPLRDRLGGWPALQILFGRRGADGKLTKEQANAIALRVAGNQIVHLLERGTIDGRPIRERDVAVLCRTNRQAKAMQAALRARGVPGVLQGDSSVFLTSEADALQRVLDALARPGDATALRSALATPIGGLDAAALLALQDDERIWEQWVVRVHRWHERWQTRGITPALRSVFEDCQVPGRLLAFDDGERRMTNLLHLGELLQHAAVEGRRGPLALAEWLGEMRSDARQSGVVGEAAQIRLESDDDAVRLLTIHKSKGLEFPIVVCPFVWDGGLLQDGDKRYPHCHDARDGRRIVDVGSADHAAHVDAATEEARAESVRLLYVAMTRARHHCSVVWQVANGAADTAFAYLVHRPGPPAASEPIHAAVAAHLAGSSDDRLRQDLQALAARAGGAIDVCDIVAEPMARRAARPTELAPLRARSVQRRLNLSWRTSSFSGLVAAATDRLSAPLEEGLDRDESAVDDAAPVPLDAVDDFPGGTRSGVMVHRLFEVLDQRVLGDAAALRALVGTTLQAYGIEPQWAPAVSRTLTDVLDTPLPAAAPFTLRQVAAARRLPEVEFIFPVAAADAAGAALTAARLAAVFARHARAPLPPDYAARLATLPFAPLAGFLKGYIDLIFEHGGRWYLVDYKSNRLGARVDDYRPDRLVAVMARHHYILQYHLYAVALHRYLQRRLPGYDYERDCGGAFYLFVRGMGPTRPAGCGVYHDRPPLALVEALSAALDEPAQAAR